MAQRERNQAVKPEQTNDFAGSFDTAVFATDFAKAFRKVWIVVILISMLCGFAAYAYKNHVYVPYYESDVTFSVSADTGDQNASSSYTYYYDTASTNQMIKTFPYIIRTSLMTNALKNRLSVDYINGTITADPVASSTNIFKVTVSSTSASDAFSIVNAVIDVYPDVAQFILGNISLHILIQPVQPTEPYTTNSFLKIVSVAAMAGFVFCCVLISAYILFRRTLRKKTDIKDRLNLDCLVEIPALNRYKKGSSKKNRNVPVPLTETQPAFTESFKSLRKRLISRMDKAGAKVLFVTSAGDKQGKTTVAVHLAHALTSAGFRVLLIDADLRDRALEPFFANADQNDRNASDTKETDPASDAEPKEHTTASDGLAELFTGVATDPERLISKAATHLYLIGAGKAQARYNAHAMTELIEQVSEQFDYIIVDSHAVGGRSEAVNYASVCDAVMLVEKQDNDSIDRIRRSIEILAYADTPIIGVVFNCVSEGYSGYGGGYYGRYGSYGRYGYGRYGYGRYGYGRYGYGKYGSDREGYGYGYGYGEEEPERKRRKRRQTDKEELPADLDDISDAIDDEPDTSSNNPDPGPEGTPSDEIPDANE